MNRATWFATFLEHFKLVGEEFAFVGLVFAERNDLVHGRVLIFCIVSALLSMRSFAAARTEKFVVAPAAQAALDRIYSGDIDGGIADSQRLEQENPDQPIGYLLEAEAIWWQIWCTSAEFKFGMTFPRHRAKLSADRHYFEVAAKVTSFAEAQIRQHDTAEMQFYAGMGDALAARLYGLRGEGRNTARFGVRAREHFVRALAIDPDFADADFGLGLYDYYVDTLSAFARVLGFFMGIPGGNKQDGIRRLQRSIDEGILTPPAARFYLAINLHTYERQYERALQVITPLAEKYPSNPMFQLARGDLFAKLDRKEQALQCYRAAASAVMPDSQCRQHIQDLVRASLAALGAVDTDVAPR